MAAQSTDLNKGFKLGDCVVEPQRERVTVAGESRHLEPKVMQVLVELATHAQQPVTREQLLDRVWNDAVVGEEVLSRAVSLLRSTLGDERTDPKYIRTIPRKGYELILPVEPLPAPLAEDGPASGVAAGNATPPVKSLVVIAGVSLVGVLVAAFAFISMQNGRKVMVMMPLKANGSELGGIAKGMSDGLHNLISGGQGVQLVARSWSFAVRDPDMAAKGIAEQFDADFLLEGTLSKPALQYELALELVDARSGGSLWRQRFTAADAQSLSGKVLNGVREALNERAGAQIRQVPAARAPLNEEAYRAYLQARPHWSLRGGEHIGRAAGLLHRSIELDPSFAAARLALGQVVALEPFYTAKSVSENFSEARLQLQAPLQAHPSLTSHVQALEGFMRLRTRDWQQAQEMLNSAVANDPNNALAHYWQSMYLGALGDHTGALAHARRAVELEPATPVLRDRLAITHLWLNDLPAAEREFIRAEQLGFALDFRSKAYLLYLYRSGRFDDLRRLLLNMGLSQDWVMAFVAGLEDPGLRLAAIDATKVVIANNAIPRELHFGVWVLLREPQLAIDAFDFSFKSPDVEFLWAKECEFLVTAPGYPLLLETLGLTESDRKRLKNNKIAQPKKA